MERGGGGADAPCSHCWAKVLRWEMVLCAHHGNPTNERLRCKKNRSHPPSSTLFLRSFWLQARRPLCWPLPFCFDTYRLFFVLPRWTRILLIYDELAKAWPSSRHCGRVVKAIDQKSIGFIPRRFESCQCRIAFVPERSKGLDSSSSVFVLVGSNPTECIHNHNHSHPWFMTNVLLFWFSYFGQLHGTK